MKINVFWFRRDLRLDDNTGLRRALDSGLPVLPLFIFDTNITDELPANDPRITFIYETLDSINNELKKTGSSLLVKKGDPLKIWEEVIRSHDVAEVYANRDYEPYAIGRDNKIESFLAKQNISLNLFKDQVIFEKQEVVKPDNTPYTVFTPYRNRWFQKLKEEPDVLTERKKISTDRFFQFSAGFPSFEQTGFKKSNIRVRDFDLSVVPDYHLYRNLPAEDKTSYLSPHLRFGTVSIRKIVNIALRQNISFLNELIWREFFMQILFHFPHVVTDNFRSAYDDIGWRNDEQEFEKWCEGATGYPIVDAGMRQLNATGYMHNRVRMITASFLCKHLLVDWRWGEVYFAQKLLDYELSSNNGNWQWAAGTGCDAAPYFRIFNPETQQKKFDPHMKYIEKWTGHTGRRPYAPRIVEHEYARQRALEVYKSGLRKRFPEAGSRKQKVS